MVGGRAYDAAVPPHQPKPHRSPVPPRSREVGVGCVQLRVGRDRTANVEAATRAIAVAARDGADIVVLPELFADPYVCQTESHDAFALAEPLDGPLVASLAQAAAAAGAVVVASVFERRAAGVYHNTGVVLDADGSLAGIARKMHIPDDPLYFEKFYFTPGDAGQAAFRAIDTAAGRLGVLVCWDQWFPEAARLLALDGADLIAVPTAIGWHRHERDTYGDAQHDAWRTIQRSHAIANGCYLAVANRTGFEATPTADASRAAASSAAASSEAASGGIDFWGRSFLVGPDGVILAEADGEPGTISGRVSPQLVESTRTGWPFFRDRRIDAYGDLLTRWRQ